MVVFSYKIIGFKFVSNPPPTEATCRKICEMSGVKGFQVGKTKVFLRYFHVDELNLKLKPFPDAAKKLQKRMLAFCHSMSQNIHSFTRAVCKTFLSKKRLAKYKAQAEKYVSFYAFHPHYLMALLSFQRKLLEPFMGKVEKSCPGTFRSTERACARLIDFCSGLVTVLETMNAADAARPENYWVTKPLQDKVLILLKHLLQRLTHSADGQEVRQEGAQGWRCCGHAAHGVCRSAQYAFYICSHDLAAAPSAGTRRLR